MHGLVSILVPLGICVGLPCGVLGIVFRFLNNRVNKNAAIAIKAIENNSAIDVDKLVAAMANHEKTPRQVLNLRLLRGCIFSLTGIALIIFAAVLSFKLPGLNYETLPLLVGSLLVAIGIAYLIVYFVTRKSVDQDTNNAAE